ncbi:uncharacterized protein LOC119570020 [Penaeus monodon]|uniref:uncharacterized protein LOC119570020 n=1 Tax=Penaeus monodon TaxID=6687 RepID=UPI0018A744C7|nr:uncharacterized protein LOC119570020 [Penaeus monodon]
MSVYGAPTQDEVKNPENQVVELKEARAEMILQIRFRKTLERRRQEERCDWETTQKTCGIWERKSVAKPPEGKAEKETWWWYDEVQRRISEKKEAKKKLFEDPSEENKAYYKTNKKEAKRAVGTPKARALTNSTKTLIKTEGETREKEQVGEPGEVEAIP